MDTQKRIIPVILCGGRGTRLQPLSTSTSPKQFLKLMQGETLLHQTIIRAMECAQAPACDIVTITTKELEAQTREALNKINPALTKNLLLEDQGRNTAPAIAQSTHHILNQFGEHSLILVLPTDHIIDNTDSFKQVIQTGVETAMAGNIVTFGLPPTYAETGYGYIAVDTCHSHHKTAGSQTKNATAIPVIQFTEKPDKKTAHAYLRQGNHLWNSGIFLFNAKTIAQSYNQLAPDIWHFTKLVSRETNGEHCSAISPQPFDKAILEKADNCWVIPCDLGWQDIGSWTGLFHFYLSKFNLSKRKA